MILKYAGRRYTIMTSRETNTLNCPYCDVSWPTIGYTDKELDRILIYHFETAIHKPELLSLVLLELWRMNRK